MGHCANFAPHNKSQEALLGMFILYFYPGLIFALNCDNSLTVFMLKASCLCHERSFASISIDNSQNRNSGILLENFTSTYLEVLATQYHPYIPPPQSTSSATASTRSPTKSKRDGNQAQILLLKLGYKINLCI